MKTEAVKTVPKTMDMNKGSSISVLPDCGLDGQSLISGRGKEFFF